MCQEWAARARGGDLNIASPQCWEVELHRFPQPEAIQKHRKGSFPGFMFARSPGKPHRRRTPWEFPKIRAQRLTGGSGLLHHREQDRPGAHDVPG